MFILTIVMKMDIIMNAMVTTCPYKLHSHVVTCVTYDYKHINHICNPKTKFWHNVDHQNNFVN
jgi:hypothetical protein